MFFYFAYEEIEASQIQLTTTECGMLLLLDTAWVVRAGDHQRSSTL